MTDNLERQDIEEKRAKCALCGHVLTYPEYIQDNRCVFCGENHVWQGLGAWLCFALAEYRVYRKKLTMARARLTVSDFEACVGQHTEDIGKIQDAKAMNNLLRELKHYKALGA